MISAVILTKNAQKNLDRCLNSLRWCDEILIIDDSSTDATVEIAKKLGAKVFKHDLKGNFAAQHNFGLSQAKGDWVLFIDADEVISEKLASEIIGRIANTISELNGFYLKRLDYFWGRPLYHGETGQIRLLRLAKKNAGQWLRKVHETWDIEGPLGSLGEPLLHYPHPTINDFLSRINHWTDIDAQELPKEGKKFSWLRAIINPGGKFLQNYFLRFGFLDGWPGLISAFMMSLYSLTVRVKMFEHDLSQTS